MLRIVATLLRHTADSPTLSDFPPSSGPDQEEPVLTVLSDFTQHESSSHPMSRTTHALNSTMTPVPENPVASERRWADAFMHLTNNRSNAFQADGYQGFTSCRNSAPSSTPARPSVQSTSVSASDDPNDPDFYDDNFDDNDLPPHTDPTLIVLNNLAGVVSLLARNSR